MAASTQAASRSRRPVEGAQDRILDAATRLFAARGVDGVALQEIAEAAQLRKPSLLYHFASKEALREAVFERLLRHWNDVLPELLVAATSGEERFERVLRELVRFFSSDPARAQLLLREVLDRPTALGAVMVRHLPRWIDVVASYIRRGQEEGRIHPRVDPEAYILHVITLVVGTCATVAGLGHLLPGGASFPVPDQTVGKRRPAVDRSATRYTDELVRIAHAALFRSVDNAATPGTAIARAERSAAGERARRRSTRRTTR